jgi:MerR family mercuric resistance operon transcriptional regulator
LDDIRALLRLARGDGKDVRRMEVRSLAASHVADIRAKIADLQAMERVLTDAICKCDTGQQPRCPLMKSCPEIKPRLRTR